MAGERVDQRRAMLAVVEQHDGLGATGLIIGKQHGAKLVQQCIGGRQRIGRRTGRAGRRALAAAGTHFRIDVDVIAIRRNRPGRAKIETAVAAGDL
jgi:hypothetical protein